MLIGLSWLARTAPAMVVVFLVSGQNQHPVFDLRLAELALTGSVLGIFLLIGDRIAGIQHAQRFTWPLALVNIPIADFLAVHCPVRDFANTPNRRPDIRAEQSTQLVARRYEGHRQRGRRPGKSPTKNQLTALW